MCVCGGGEDGEDEFMCTVYMHRLIPRFPFPGFHSLFLCSVIT